MTHFQIIIAVVGLLMAGSAVVHAPRLLATGIAVAVCGALGARAASADAALTPRAALSDRWGPAPRADARALARSFRIAMQRTELHSLFPEQFR